MEGEGGRRGWKERVEQRVEGEGGRRGWKVWVEGEGGR